MFINSSEIALGVLIPKSVMMAVMYSYFVKSNRGAVRYLSLNRSRSSCFWYRASLSTFQQELALRVKIDLVAILVDFKV